MFTSMMMAAVGAKAIEVGNDTAGADAFYNVGGVTTNLIQKTLFATLASTNLAATLSSARYGASCTWSSTDGYVAGGINGSSNIYNVDKINMLNDTRSSTLANAAVMDSTNGNPYGGSGISTTTKGFNLAACDPYSGIFLSTIYGTDFASDTIAKMSFSIATPNLTSTSHGAQSKTKGYVFNCNVASTYTNFPKALDFSTHTISAVSGTLSYQCNQNSITQSASSAYVLGGGSGNSNCAISSQINKMIFSSEAVSLIADTLPSRVNQAGGSYDANNGYASGGWNGAAAIKTICGVSFATETTFISASTLATAIRIVGVVQR